MGEGSYLLLVLVNLFLVLLHLLCLWQHFLPELLTFLTLLVKLSRKLFKLRVKESFCSWQSVFVSVLMFSCFVKIFCAIKFLSCAVKLCYDRFKLVLAVSFNFCHLAKCFLSVFTKCLGLENRQMTSSFRFSLEYAFIYQKFDFTILQVFKLGTTKPGLWTGLDYGLSLWLQNIILEVVLRGSSAVQPMFHLHNMWIVFCYIQSCGPGFVVTLFKRWITNSTHFVHKQLPFSNWLG